MAQHMSTCDATNFHDNIHSIRDLPVEGLFAAPQTWDNHGEGAILERLHLRRKYILVQIVAVFQEKPLAAVPNHSRKGRYCLGGA